MADASVIPSDEEEGDDGDEGDEEGEGDDGGEDDGGRTPDVASSIPQDQDQDQDQDQEMGDSEASEVIRPSSIEEPEDNPRAPPSEEEDITIPRPRFPPPALGGLGPLHPPTHLASPRIEGSPLKNVILQSPTDASPMISPRIASTAGSFSASGYMEASMSMDITGSGAVVSETFVSETAFSTGGVVTEQVSSTTVDYAGELEPMPAGLAGNVPGSVETLSRVEELPDTVDESHDTPAIPHAEEVPVEKQPEIPPPTFEFTEPPPESQVSALAERTPPTLEQEEPQPSVPEPPRSPTLLPADTADETDGINLLSSLEMELNRQEALSSAASSVGGQKTPTPPLPAAANAAPADVGAAVSEDSSAAAEIPKAVETTEPLP